jgi:hypothetical protein
MQQKIFLNNLRIKIYLIGLILTWNSAIIIKILPNPIIAVTA